MFYRSVLALSIVLFIVSLYNGEILTSISAAALMGIGFIEVFER